MSGTVRVGKAGFINKLSSYYVNTSRDLGYAFLDLIIM